MTLSDMIPPLVRARPAYEAALTLRTKLGERRAVLTEQLHRLARLAAGQETKADREAKGARVAALMGDRAPAPSASPLPHKADLQREAADLDEAITLADQRVREERAVASAVVCEQVRSKHDARVSAVCRALIAAHGTQLAYLDFADRVNAEGVMWTQGLRPMHPLFLEGPRDAQSSLAQYLREAVESGFIKADEIPQELRQ